MDKPWLNQCPAGVPAEIDVDWSALALSVDGELPKSALGKVLRRELRD